jgi:F-type H+-transporting ATPase subunit delta
MIVADRYARSLLQLASEKNQLDSVRADMKTIARICHESVDFTLFLSNPLIHSDKKIQVLNTIFGDKVSGLTLSFIELLTRHRRENHIAEIANSFDEQYKRNKNILTAVITSAQGLDDAMKKKVTEMIRSQMNTEVELKERIDPSAIGGFILRIGDKQVDKSVVRQLNNLKKQLISRNLN